MCCARDSSSKISNLAFEAWEPEVWDETMKDGNCAARNEAEHRQVRVF